MPDFPMTVANSNDQFRQVMHTGKTSQVALMALKPRETASFGGPEDSHYFVSTGMLREEASDGTAGNTLTPGMVLSIFAGSVQRVTAGEEGVKLVKIGGIEAPEGSSAPTREVASAQTLERVTAREFNIAQRKEAAASGAAMKDGSFPVYNGHDLENAASLIHHADDPVKAKAHVVARAKTLGLPLPYSLRDNSEAM